MFYRFYYIIILILIIAILLSPIGNIIIDIPKK